MIESDTIQCGSLDDQGCYIDAVQSGRLKNYVYYMRGGKLCRRRYVVPANVRTSARERARKDFGAMSQAWDLVLTEEQRRAWTVAGAKVERRPRAGQSGPLPGPQHFAGINSARLAIGREILLWPPERVVFGPNPVAGLRISWVNGRVRMALRVWRGAGLAEEEVRAREDARPTGEEIMVFGAAPCGARRKKWRHGAYLGLLPAAEGGESDITELYVKRYGEPKVGERVFIRTRQQRDGWEGANKEVSETVEAEVAAKPRAKRIEGGGLRMEGRASGDGFAGAEGILLKMRDSWVLDCGGGVGELNGLHKLLGLGELHGLYGLQQDEAWWRGQGRDEGCTREQCRRSPIRPPLQCRRCGGGRMQQAEGRRENGGEVEVRWSGHWRELWRGS